MKPCHFSIVIVYCIVLVKGEVNPQYDNGNCVKNPSLTGILNCGAEKLIKLINTAALVETFEIIPGISVISDSNSLLRTPKELVTNYDLPLDTYDRFDRLMELLLYTTNRFISNKSLQIHLTNDTDKTISRTLEEGRGKMKKMVGSWYILGIGAMVIVMVPVLMGGLALLTAKSVLISNMALVVSVIVLMKNYFSGTAFSTPSYWSTNSYGSPYPYGPSYSYGVNNLGGWSQEKIVRRRSLSNKQAEAVVKESEKNIKSKLIHA